MTVTNSVPSVRRITALYRSATLEQRMAGAEWYPIAAKEAETMSTAYGISMVAASGILAALSPLLSWELNVRYAHVIASGADSAPCLSSNVAKAVRIRNGEMPLDVLGGDKVRAFYAAIVSHGRDGMAVIDRHAVAVTVGHVVGDKDRARLVGTPKRYAELSAMYARAAAALGTSVHDVQATTWCVWRDAHQWETTN